MRQGEENGRHYHFISRGEFERRVAAGAFLEWAEYSGELYGTLHDAVQKGLASGRHVVLDIEVRGARQVRERVPDSVQVFVLPPSAAVLVQRLRGRNTEDPGEVARRLGIARGGAVGGRGVTGGGWGPATWWPGWPGCPPSSTGRRGGWPASAISVR